MCALNPLKEKAIVFLATGGLIGYAPKAPGTFGSLSALPLCLGLALLPWKTATLLIVALTLVSVWISGAAATLLGEKDPKSVVIDEIWGMAIALTGLPFTFPVVFFGFLGFRFFDILKPFPIRWIDKKLSGGWGIMLDDVLAGIFTNILIRAGMYLFF
ncbi:phosphatidylglycerophosphatase A [Desulfosarcina sp. OttesenSCG-928-A07]|nr:phosphatidylglycerophosphatase A [Desulfosarcina sp. OttesenSCG-928-A07]